MPDTSDELDAIVERFRKQCVSKTNTGNGFESTKADLLKWRDKAIRAEMLSMLQDEKTPPEFARWAEYTASSPVVREHYRNELREQLRQQVISRYGAEDGDKL